MKKTPYKNVRLRKENYRNNPISKGKQIMNGITTHWDI